MTYYEEYRERAEDIANVAMDDALVGQVFATLAVAEKLDELYTLLNERLPPKV